MTPEDKFNWRLLVMAFVLPGLIVWAIYYSGVSYFAPQIFKFGGSRAEFPRQFFEADLAKNYPPIDVVILGDSTARSAINPVEIDYLFAVNLALNGGTALTSYHILERYLRTHPKPKCVVYVSQYNWDRNYGYFFERIVFYRLLDPVSLFDVWKMGIQNGVFPRTDYSTVGFFTASLRQYLYLGELPANLIQEAIQYYTPERAAHYNSLGRKNVYYRGFQNNELRSPQPESVFFTDERHGAYLGPFVPYATEDFYLRALIERTGKLGIKLLWGSVPMADSEHYTAAKIHQASRDLHVLKIMQNNPHVIQVPMPKSMPRQLYFDFTHMEPEGARALRPYLDSSLRENCAP